MRPTDGKALRRLCVRLSILLKSGLSDLEALAIDELFEIAEEVSEAYGK